MAIRTDIFKTGEMPPLIWCIGFNVEKPIGQKSDVWPADLAVYVNYRGKPHILDREGLMHITKNPDYWVEMEK